MPSRSFLRPLAVTLALVLVGCGGSIGPATSPDASPALTPPSVESASTTSAPSGPIRATSAPTLAPSSPSTPPVVGAFVDPERICEAFIREGLSAADPIGCVSPGVDGGAMFDIANGYIVSQQFYPMTRKASLAEIKKILKIALPTATAKQASDWVTRAFARREVVSWGVYFGPLLINVFNSSAIDPVGTPNNGYDLGITDCTLSPDSCAPLKPRVQAACEEIPTMVYCALPKP